MGCKNSKALLEPPPTSTTKITPPSKPIKSNENQITCSNKEKLSTFSQNDNQYENNNTANEDDNIQSNNQQIKSKEDETKKIGDDCIPKDDKSTSFINRETSLTKTPSNSSHLSASLKISQESTEIILNDNILLDNNDHAYDIKKVDSNNDKKNSNQNIVENIQEEKKSDEIEIEEKQISLNEQLIDTNVNKDQVENHLSVAEVIHNHTQKNHDDTTIPDQNDDVQGGKTTQTECYNSKEEVYLEKNRDNDNKIFSESERDTNNSLKDTDDDVPGTEEQRLIPNSTNRDEFIKMESVQKLGTMSLDQKMKSFFCNSKNSNSNPGSEQNDPSNRPPLSPSPRKIQKSYTDYMESASLSRTTLSYDENPDVRLARSQKMIGQNTNMAESSVKSYGRSSRTSSPSVRTKGTKKKLPDSPYRKRRQKIQEEMQKENPMETLMMNLIQNIEKEQSENSLHRLDQQFDTGFDETKGMHSNVDDDYSTSSVTKRSKSKRGRLRGSEEERTKAMLTAHNLHYLHSK